MHTPKQTLPIVKVKYSKVKNNVWTYIWKVRSSKEIKNYTCVFYIYSSGAVTEQIKLAGTGQLISQHQKGQWIDTKESSNAFTAHHKAEQLKGVRAEQTLRLWAQMKKECKWVNQRVKMCTYIHKYIFK